MDAIRQQVRSVIAGTWAAELPLGMICVQREEKDDKGRHKSKELKPGDTVPDDAIALGAGGWTEQDELAVVHIDYDVGHGRPSESYVSPEEALQAAARVRDFVNGASEERLSKGGRGLHQRVFVRAGQVRGNARQASVRIAQWLVMKCDVKCDRSALGRQNLWFWAKETPLEGFKVVHERLPAAEWTVPNDALAHVEKKPKKTKNPRQSQAAALIELLQDPTYIRDGERLFIRIKVTDHQEVVEIPSPVIKQLLTKLYYDKTKSTCRQASLNEACSTIAARARYEGQAATVHFKVAMQDGRLYVDLFNDRWQVVEISPDGWKVLNASPVLFCRNNQVKALPTPVAGGSLNDLKQLINYGSQENWVLLCAWILGAFHPTGPYPILFVSGQHGSAKTTLCRTLKQLIDPQEVDERFAPADATEVILAAYNSYVLAFDNLSGISKPMSDILCKVSTGGGMTKRRHYCDTDEVCIKVKRPVILNSIEDVISQSDLADRAICLQVPVIPKNGRRLESDLKSRFDTLHPSLLGALFTVLSTVLKNRDSVSRSGLPRMADFAAWAIAGEEALGLPSGSVLEAYNRCSTEYSASLLEGNVVCDVIRHLVERSPGVWTGTCANLLNVLQKKVPPGQSSTIPKSPRALRNLLNRLIPNFSSCHVELKFEHTGTERRVTIVNTAFIQNAPTAVATPNEFSTDFQSAGQ